LTNESYRHFRLGQLRSHIYTIEYRMTAPNCYWSS